MTQPRRDPLTHPMLAVVDGVSSGIAVWWVRVYPAPGVTSRLSGAWLLDPAGEGDKLRSVLAGRIGLPTDDGRKALADAGLELDVELDLTRTLHAVSALRTELLEVFHAQQQGRSPRGRRVEPQWPNLPDRLVFDEPMPDPPTEAARTLGIARHFDRLIEAWHDLELIRTTRKLGGDTTRLPFPLVLTGTP